MVVTQSIGYYIYLVRSRSVGKIMDCKATLMPPNELINIREMSKRSSVPAATLRYYEKLGLITSERKTSGSHRRYSEATLHRITYITLAQGAGFSLEEVTLLRLHRNLEIGLHLGQLFVQFFKLR